MFGFKRIKKVQNSKKKVKNFIGKNLISKRQRFIFSVIFLSIGLFIAEVLIGKSGMYFVMGLAVATVILLYFSLRQDLKDNFTIQTFILPFIYTLGIGLFYLLVPARFITRVGMTSLYALGLYSLFLSQNIFTVSAIRTIQLLSSARTVSLVLSLLSYFFISNVVFSFHINVFITLALIFIYTFLMVMQAIWVYTLEKNPLTNIFWVLGLSICIAEIALFLWFGPSSPTVAALFLTAIFYVLTGVTQAWFEKRLFRSVILEYFWLTIISILFLSLFTNWV
jgi:hypothetical protein